MSASSSSSFSVTALVDAIIEREGRYVNHQSDRGGPTCWGITQAVARSQGYEGDMRHLPRSLAVSIYTEIYWKKPSFDKVALRAAKIAAELFDTGVNMGTATASGFLQRALNALNRSARDYPDLVLDQHIGPRTISALDGYIATRGSYGEIILLRAMEALQGERYITLAERRPSQEAFLYGWLANRIGQDHP